MKQLIIAALMGMLFGCIVFSMVSPKGFFCKKDIIAVVPGHIQVIEEVIEEAMSTTKRPNNVNTSLESTKFMASRQVGKGSDFAPGKELRNKGSCNKRILKRYNENTS
jgi:hypothetical protein